MGGLKQMLTRGALRLAHYGFDRTPGCGLNSPEGFKQRHPGRSGRPGTEPQSSFFI